MNARVIAELGHFAPLVPMLMCVVLQIFGRNPSPHAWLLTCAFFVSFISDQIAAVTSGFNLWLFYFYAPLQLGLVAAVLAPTLKVRAITIAPILIAAGISIAFSQGFANVEYLTQVIGGLVIVYLMKNLRLQISWYALPLTVYFVLTIPPLLVMGYTTPALSGPWFNAWATYQGLRVLALVLMAGVLVWKPYLRLEAVTDGPRTGEITAERRSAIGAFGSGYSNAVEEARRVGAI